MATGLGALAKGFLLNPVTIGITALTAFITVAYNTSKAIDEIRDKAARLGDEFNGTKSNIDDYKKQIQSLYKTINDESSSVQQVTEARQTLMTVQDQLIDKFGSEKETIDVVTEAINGQSDALDKLTDKKWQEVKNDFNNESFWQDFANDIYGYQDNIERMVNEMENTTSFLNFSSKNYNNKKYKELVKQLEDKGWSYDWYNQSFIKSGSLKEINDELLTFQDTISRLQKQDSLANDKGLKKINEDIGKEASETKSILNQYSDIWDTYVLNERILANEDLADSFKNVNDAYSEYTEAVKSGDAKLVDDAIDNFSEKLNEAITNGGDDKGVVEYFENMYPTLAREAEKWEFKTNIIPEFDTSKLKGKTQKDILEMLQTSGTQEGEDIFTSILENATEAKIVTGEYSNRVQSLLDLLTEWDILQEDIAEPSNEIDNSSTIEQLTTQITSFKTAQESLTTAFSEQSSTGTISNETLATLKENYEGIENAIEFTTDGIILNTSKLRDLNEEQRKNTANELAKKEEDLAKKYQDATLKLAEYNKLSNEHSNENDNLKSVYDDLVNSQQIEVDTLEDEIAGLKALQKEYNNSISTHNAFMEALSSANEGAGYESIVSSLEQVQEKWDKGLYGTDDIRTFVDYMTSADMSNASIDEIISQFETAMQTAKEFFTENKDGSKKFLELLKDTTIEVDGVTQALATYNESTGKWDINIQDMAKASEATGYSTDFLIDNLNRLKDFGFDVVFGEVDDFTNYQQAIDDVNKEIADTQIALDKTGGKSEELKQKLEDLNTVKVNLEENIPTSAVDEAIKKIQRLEAEIQGLQSMSAPTDVINQQTAAKRQKQEEIAKTAGIELTAIIGADTKKAESAAENLKKAIEKSTATMNVEANVKPAQDAIDGVANKTYTANLKLKLTTVNSDDVERTINHIKETAKGAGGAYGTVNIGKSFAGGNIGTDKTLHNVMVSEVQPEMVVDPRSGQYTIYKYPTMLDKLPKDSIIFNGKQTAEILKNGMTTSFGKAYANGTLTGSSFATKGTATSSGDSGLLNEKSTTSSTDKSTDKTREKTKKKTKQLIDWIERRINVLTTKAERWSNIIEKATDPNRIDSYYKKLDSITQKQVKTYGDAYNRYMSKANTVKLSNDLKNKVQSKDSALFDKNGNLKSQKALIKKYGEKTYEKIQDYQNWYDKAISAIDEFTESSYKLANSPLEKAADKIDLLSKSMEVLDAQLETFTVNDYINANKKIQEQYENSASQNAANQSALKTATSNIKAGNKIKNADEVKNNKKLIEQGKKLNELDLSKYTLGSKAYKQAVKYNAYVAAYNNALIEAQKSEAELIKQNIEYRKQQFDNVQKYYDEALNDIQHEYDMLDSEIKLLETRGAFVTTNWYKDQSELEKDKLATLNDERKSLADQIKLLENEKNGKYSEEWYACNKAIQEVDKSIKETSVSLSELNNKMNETTTSLIDLYLGVGDRAKNELNFIVDLMGDIEDFNMNHAVTSEGLARLESYTANMSVSAEQAGLLKNAVEKLQDAYNKGKKSVSIEGFGDYDFSAELSSNKKFQENINELYDKWQDRIEETYEYQSKVIGFMRNKLKEELSALQENISARKEAIEAEKTLRDYQKNVREQTTNIGLLQKQLASISGDNSEEGTNRYLQLQKELSDAEEQLEETEFQHMIDEMNSALQKLSDEYSATIDQLSADTGYLLEESNKLTSVNNELIQGLMEEYKKQTGYVEQFDLSKILSETLNSEGSVLNNIKSALNGEGESILNKLVKDPDSILTAIKKDGEKSGDNNSNNNNSNINNGLNVLNTTSEPDEHITENSLGKITTPLTNPLTNFLSNITPTKLESVVEGPSKSDVTNWIKKKAQKPDKKKSEYSDTNKKIWDLTSGKVLSGDNLKALAKYVGITYDNAKSSGKLYKTLKKIGVKGFDQGGIGKLVPAGEDGLAWVRNGEGFVRPEDVKHIQELLNVVPDMKDILKPVNIPNIQPVNNNSSIGDIQFNIEMNGVNDVETFSKQIREAYCSDERIVKMIQCDNIMQLKPNSTSYNRNRYR